MEQKVKKILELFQENYPYEEQRVLISSYSALIELLKYQKEKIKDKVVWEAYMGSFRDMVNKDLGELIKG